MRKKVCGVVGCFNRAHINKNVSFFEPVNSKQLEKWSSVNPYGWKTRKNKKKIQVCSDHFEKEDLYTTFNGGLRRLQPKISIPKMFSPWYVSNLLK